MTTSPAFVNPFPLSIRHPLAPPLEIPKPYSPHPHPKPLESSL